MFQFSRLALFRVLCLQHSGLSHSEIFGLTVVCTYPKLIAAYHVLHRLSMPRHPPYALVRFKYCLVFSPSHPPRRGGDAFPSPLLRRGWGRLTTPCFFIVTPRGRNATPEMRYCYLFVCCYIDNKNCFPNMSKNLVLMAQWRNSALARTCDV